MAETDLLFDRNYDVSGFAHVGNRVLNHGSLVGDEPETLNGVASPPSHGFHAPENTFSTPSL